MEERNRGKQTNRAQQLGDQLGRWLSRDVQPRLAPRTDFELLCEHVRPADVLLVEGRSRVSGVIQSVTLSSWSHAALYLGKAEDVADERAREQALRANWPDSTQLLLEAEMGIGVHLTPLTRYRGEHLRICRPRELTEADRMAVIRYVCDRLGTPYDMRQILDLLRFFFPYGLLPRHWRSTLFEAGHGDMVRVICSTLIANAFASVRYPIVPTMHRGPDGDMVFHRRNSRLISPRDFDHSPYFEIIKFPFFADDVERYRELIWDNDAPSASRPVRHRLLQKLTPAAWREDA